MSSSVSKIIGLMSRVFAGGPRDRSSILGRVHTKDFKNGTPLGPYRIMLSVKQGGVKFHFLVLPDLGLNQGLPGHWQKL